jgi:hypothetical protein
MPKTHYTVPDTRKSPVTVTTHVEPLYLDKQQRAQTILVSTRTVDNWREDGVIPFIKVKGVVRFDLAKVKAALEKRFEVRERQAR